jgi:hypothetical protein
MLELLIILSSSSFAETIAYSGLTDIRLLAKSLITSHNLHCAQNNVQDI